MSIVPVPRRSYTQTGLVNLASVLHGTSSAFESPNCADALWQAKNAMVTAPKFPWTVTKTYVYLGSVTNSDQWTDYTKISGSPTGAALGSWILLTQPVTGAQVVIAVTLFGSNQFAISMNFSPGGLFTGGTTVAIPTATDGVLLTNSSVFLGTFSVASVSFIVHVVHSDDGESTRVIFTRTNNALLSVWSFDKVGNPVPGWTTPNVALFISSSDRTGTTAVCTIASLSDTSVPKFQGSGPLGALRLFPAMRGLDDTIRANFGTVLRQTGFLKNKISNLWHLLDVTLLTQPSSDTQAGEQGLLTDMWFSGIAGSAGDATMRSIPDPANSSVKVAMGLSMMIIAWPSVAVPGVSDVTEGFFTPEVTTAAATTTPTAAATFSTPIPALASQIFPSGETLQVTTGSLQTLPSSRWYYLVSNRTTASNGQSLLFEIKTLLDASLGGTSWTVVINKVGTTYRIQLSHNNGSSRTITFSAAFALALGFASTSVVVATSTTVTADYPSYWWWTPDMPVSMTGPTIFDHSLNFGVPVSAGASQRSSDMTAAYVQNGIQYDAEFMFSAVQFYYKIRPNGTYQNQDFETWWKNGPCKGRRFLFWRNRDNATGSNAPTAGGSSPYRYVEYAPQEDLRGVLPAKPTAPPNLVYWDVTLKCWVTDSGEAVLTV